MPSDARSLLKHVDQLLRARAPYDELVAALDACDRVHGADAVRPGIVQRRLAIARLYQRGTDELVRIANAGIPFLWAIPPIDAAPTILASCAGVPELEHHLLRLQQALEAAPDDGIVATVLDHVATALRETRSRA